MPDLNQPTVLLVAAPFIGSFIGVLARRLPNGDEVIFSRSRCPHCARPLAPLDLVPVLSWLSTHGRCRTCGHPLGLFYPLIEAAAFGVALWASLAMPGSMLWATCLFGWLLLTLAVTDYRTLILPDQLTYALIVTGLGTTALDQPGQIMDKLLGAGFGFAAFALIAAAYHRLRGRAGLGHGDAKLLAGIGSWVSWTGLPSVVLIGAVSALLVALVVLRRRAGHSDATRVPFGTFLAIGGWLVWLYGPISMFPP